jgi:hypothetical protein
MRIFIFVLIHLIFGGLATQGFCASDRYVRLKLGGFENPVDIRQSNDKTRLDVMVGGVLQTYITDLDKRVLITLNSTNQKRVALVFPLSQGFNLVPLPLDISVIEARAELKIIGASQVSNMPCRLMAFSNYLNQSGIVCVASDGLILQMTQGGRNQPLFEVLSLDQSSQPIKWFQIPAEYQTLALPVIGGASGETSDQAISPLTLPKGSVKSKTKLRGPIKAQ